MSDTGMFFSKSLRYYANSLANFRRNQVRVRPTGNDNALAGATTRIDFPANSIINMASWALHFDAALQNNGGNASDVVAPPPVWSLIERMNVLVNGISISNISNYGALYQTLYNLTAGKDKVETHLPTHNPIMERSALRRTDEFGTAGTRKSYVLDSHLGLFQCEPQYLDTSLLGDLSVEITWAFNQGMQVVRNAADAASQVVVANQYHDIVAVFDVISFEDQIYRSLIAAKLAEGSIQVPFSNWFIYQGAKSSSGTFRTTCSSRSIDTILLTGRPTAGTGQTITNGNTGWDYQAIPAGDGSNLANGDGVAALDDGSINCGKSGGKPPAMRFNDLAINSLYFNVDAMRMPSFNLDTPEHQLQAVRVAYSTQEDMSTGDLLCTPLVDGTATFGGKNSSFATGATAANMAAKLDAGNRAVTGGNASEMVVVPNIDYFQDYCWVTGVSLQHASTEEDRLTSGYDTRGNAAQISVTYETTNADLTGHLLEFINCTSILNVYDGKQVELIP